MVFGGFGWVIFSVIWVRGFVFISWIYCNIIIFVCSDFGEFGWVGGVFYFLVNVGLLN